MDLEKLKFHKEHCWVRVEGKMATIGITDYAQEELGEIVYIDQMEDGETVSADDELTEIESTKTTAPVIAPVSGRLVAHNEELKDSPELINEDPYGKGWIAVIEMSSPKEINDLMDNSEYEEYKEEQ